MYEFLNNLKTQTTTAEPPAPESITTLLELTREVNEKRLYILENKNIVLGWPK
jgi:hypothetical protein